MIFRPFDCAKYFTSVVSCNRKASNMTASEVCLMTLSKNTLFFKGKKKLMT